ncbi:LacI family DNA-binding transcriptional regulator [Marinobacterium rhizophilum]|uniref:LacI family DNA-binding transcriptional regulator n=1 Tax=Marinobacterium rhizophilum TaxID=420402 RepID=A0ABY5HGR1_9GAMM|nr:LacI family DNA-binding transcriptional regulator [Marinobacterium rhizophilum]UTW11159.1 LacI family DNA-binding transcriptional regulator [Marinobacterium rhizophilum]
MTKITIPLDNPTLDDVARHADVSPATVSRFMNNPSIVSERSKRKIEESIRELSYVPHAAARTLASKKSRMIGVVVPSLDDALFGHFLELFHSHISTEGYTTVVASSGYSSDEEHIQITQMVSHGVDALLLVGLARDESVYSLLNKKKIPYAITWATDDLGEHSCVGFSNHDAAVKITEYLMDLGHRQFAMISGTLKGNDRASNRLQGVRDALARRELSLPDELVIEGPIGIEHGQKAFKLLMSRSPRPTVIVCGADPLAYGAIFESKVLGVEVPQDVSITGFDDTWLAAHLTPSLTTLRTPQQQMSLLSAEYLIAKLKGEDVDVPPTLGVDLVVRESCSSPA